MSLLTAVLHRKQPLDEALTQGAAARALDRLSPRDRAFARAISATALRRKGQIDAVLGIFLDRPPPKRSAPLHEILLAAATQLLFFETPPHAAIGLAVEHCKRAAATRGFGKLANAVLRRVAAEGPALVARQDAARLNTPDWLWTRWCKTYGEATTRQIATAHLAEPPLDLAVKSNAGGWAAQLAGHVLPTGAVRLRAGGRVEDLDGFAQGAWWVQDAAAALPARLLGDIAGRRVADLCAAPGGKTAQLVQQGAHVTAVDISRARLARLRDNLKRLGLAAEIVAADAGRWAPAEPFDAVLLDAPCTATGTIRRHPDIPHLKRPCDLAELTRLQARLLDHAVTLLRPGGTLVYCVCSLEPEEGAGQVAALLARGPGLRHDAIRSAEVAGRADWIDDHGNLRTLPHLLAGPAPGLDGFDGFFAARVIVDQG